MDILTFLGFYEYQSQAAMLVVQVVRLLLALMQMVAVVSKALAGAAVEVVKSDLQHHCEEFRYQDWICAGF